MTASVSVRRIGADEVLAGFDCGRCDLNDFLTQHAVKNNACGWSATYLAFLDGDLAGYVCVVPLTIQHKHVRPLIEDLPEHPAPALLLARMGVDREYRGRKVASALMATVYREAQALADRFGCAGVVTDAKAEGEGEPSPVPVYEHCGFVTIMAPKGDGATTRMFLPMAKVREHLSALTAASDSAPLDTAL